MRDPEDFLHEVASGLPFDEAERTEILEELRAHVADSVAALEADGRSPDEASRTALERLGPPERLAKALTEARRNRRRLLAAAGAGSWAVFTGGIYGWCVGVLLAWLAWAVTGLAFQIIGPLSSWTFEAMLDGTFHTLTFVGLGVAAYVAASAVTHVVAARAGYPPESVRRVVAPVGAILLGVYALVGWSGEIGVVGVVALLTLPVWWVLGTMRTSRVLRGANRTFAAIFLVAVVAIVVSLFAQMLLSDAPRGTGNGPAHPGELGLDRIAAPVPAAVADVVTGYGRASSQGDAGIAAATYVVDVADVTPLIGWTALRVEAWRATDHGVGSPTPVSPKAVGPFAVGPAVWSPPGELPDDRMNRSTGEPYEPGAMTLTGAVQLNRTPGVTAAWVAITGIAPDGRRYMLSEPDYVPASFTGTALDWLTAVVAAR